MNEPNINKIETKNQDESIKYLNNKIDQIFE